MKNKVYPRTGDIQTVYLKSVVTRPTIEIGRQFKNELRK